jgi:hypothetical protein
MCISCNSVHTTSGSVVAAATIPAEAHSENRRRARGQDGSSSNWTHLRNKARLEQCRAIGSARCWSTTWVTAHPPLMHREGWTNEGSFCYCKRGQTALCEGGMKRRKRKRSGHIIAMAEHARRCCSSFWNHWKTRAVAKSPIEQYSNIGEQKEKKKCHRQVL